MYILLETTIRDVEQDNCEIVSQDPSKWQYMRSTDKDTICERMDGRAKSLEQIYTQKSDYIRFSKAVRILDEPDHKIIVVRQINEYNQNIIYVIILKLTHIMDF